MDLHCQEGGLPDLVGETGRHRWGCLGLDRLQSGGQTGTGLGRRQTHPLRCFELVVQLKAATDGHIPFFTSDALPHYAEALLEVYGVWMTPLRQGTRGRFPHPRRCPPPDLCYAIVVKERKYGQVINITTRVVYGTLAQVEAALQVSPVSWTINTYGVERNNLTVRQHARRLGRQVNAFSKEPDYLGH